jgi:hypothetical protein
MSSGDSGPGAEALVKEVKEAQQREIDTVHDYGVDPGFFSDTVTHGPFDFGDTPVLQDDFGMTGFGPVSGFSGPGEGGPAVSGPAAVSGPTGQRLSAEDPPTMPFSFSPSTFEYSTKDEAGKTIGLEIPGLLNTLAAKLNPVSKTAAAAQSVVDIVNFFTTPSKSSLANALEHGGRSNIPGPNPTLTALSNALGYVADPVKALTRMSDAAAIPGLTKGIPVADVPIPSSLAPIVPSKVTVPAYDIFMNKGGLATSSLLGGIGSLDHGRR